MNSWSSTFYSRILKYSKRYFVLTSISEIRLNVSSIFEGFLIQEKNIIQQSDKNTCSIHILISVIEIFQSFCDVIIEILKIICIKQTKHFLDFHLDVIPNHCEDARIEHTLRVKRVRDHSTKTILIIRRSEQLNVHGGS